MDAEIYLHPAVINKPQAQREMMIRSISHRCNSVPVICGHQILLLKKPKMIKPKKKVNIDQWFITPNNDNDPKGAA